MGVFDGIWMFYRYLVFLFKKVTRIEPLHVYQRLEVTRKDGKSVKLRIQDARAQDLEPIMDFMSKWFIHEESLYRTAGMLLLSKDKTSREMITDLLLYCTIYRSDIVKSGGLKAFSACQPAGGEKYGFAQKNTSDSVIFINLVKSSF